MPRNRRFFYRYDEEWSGLKKLTYVAATCGAYIFRSVRNPKFKTPIVKKFFEGDGRVE